MPPDSPAPSRGNVSRTFTNLSLVATSVALALGVVELALRTVELPETGYLAPFRPPT